MSHDFLERRKGASTLKPPARKEEVELVALHPKRRSPWSRSSSVPATCRWLSEWDTVHRLIERTDEAWTVEAVSFPKQDFDSWFLEVSG